MLVAPSILTCDFAHAADAMRLVEQSGADRVHLDVMDGVFVPNLSFGPPVIASLRPCTALPFDVHLMMQIPDRLLEPFAKAGADSITVHFECDEPIDRLIGHIHDLGCQAAVAVKPATPAEAVFAYLDRLQTVVVMTVEPGFGGQAFRRDMLPKITALRREIDRRQLPVTIQVDGGINADTAKEIAAAGADEAVVGSALFKAADPRALVDGIQHLSVNH